MIALIGVGRVGGLCAKQRALALLSPRTRIPRPRTPRCAGSPSTPWNVKCLAAYVPCESVTIMIVVACVWGLCDNALVLSPYEHIPPPVHPLRLQAGLSSD
jgi:hypothetical protein